MTGDTSFWYFVSFAIFAAFTAKPIWVLIRDSLQNKQRTIRHELDEAQKLKDEAISLLREAKQKRQEAANQAQKILDRADKETRRIQEEATAEIAEFFKSQERQFRERLQGAEKSALADVNSRIVTMAVDIAREVIEQRMDKNLDTQVLETSIEHLEKKKQSA